MTRHNIQESFYINQDTERALELCELSLDELESIVGRFRSNSRRHGQLRGEVIITWEGYVIIRHAFTKKLIWRQS